MAVQRVTRQQLLGHVTAAYLCFCVLLLSQGDLVQATSALPGLPAGLQRFHFKRQTSTAGNNTNPFGSQNGGAQSAANAANAAGHAIDTGTGGDRSTPTTPSDFAKLLSGTFFGCLTCLFFGGAFAVQAWTYFESFGGRGADKRPIQFLVGTLLFFSLLSDAVLIHRIFEVHVKNFGDFAFPLLTIGWELTVNYICIAFMASAVQLYFAHRVWAAYGKSIFVAIPFATFIAFTFGGGIASGVLSLQSGSAANVRGEALHSFQPNSTPWKWSAVFASWLISSAAVDVALCVLLALQLSKLKSPFFSTRHAIARLLTLSIETCSLTVAFSLGAMSLFLAKPEQFYFLILLAPLGQVMALSCVATLLSRPSIANELAQDQTLGVGSRHIDQFASTAPTSIAKPVLKRIMKREEQRQPLHIQMTTTVQQTASQPDNGHFWSEKERLGTVIHEEITEVDSDHDLESQSTLNSRGRSRKGGSGERSFGQDDDSHAADSASKDGRNVHPHEEQTRARMSPVRQTRWANMSPPPAAVLPPEFTMVAVPTPHQDNIVFPARPSEWQPSSRQTMSDHGHPHVS
ncbi:unnamed protein product [Parajaminaea phylloscopi]